MTRAGDEMILELAGLLKTAAKDEEKKPEDKKEKAKEKAKDKDDKKKCKKCDKEDCACGPDKKANMTAMLQDLVKMANTLDEAGAEEAAGLVDDVIQVILKNVKAETACGGDMDEAMDDDEMMAFDEEEVFEDEPAPVDVGNPLEEDMPEMGHSGDDPGKITPEIAKLLIDQGWEPPPGYEV